ncbi:AmMst-1 [Trametes versicolor FP-101664 SS1]|uniref:AmMst-1 n=1 Tax=Trametes versicolor (strain FP-101664) TaxID=717944 RepID=UPI000462241C|nr:AmMst-1 [Trametes versicolor FP-101664 SS1]EIW53905.1 AmMst-1 [Trametes versicolor FP-101664 SS1]
MAITTASSGGLLTAVPTKAGISGIAMTAFAAFGGMLFGYDTGTISGIIQMNNWIMTFGKPDSNSSTGYSVSTSRESLVVSILSAGTFFGALAGAPAADILGRRISIMLTCIVFSLGVSLQAGAPDFATFVVGRVFAGIGVGLVSTLIPMYQSECSPKWIRGALVSCYQWAISIGLLLSAVVNNATKDRPDHSAWQIPISVQLVWAFVLFVGMIWLPETPRWLVKQDRREDAAKSMSRLRSLPVNDPVVQSELEEIAAALEEEREMDQSSYADCFRFTRNKIALRTLTGIALQAWQQLTGINFISYYGVTFFTSSGIKNPFLVSVITNVVGTSMTVFGIWAVDRFGRRAMLLWGAAVMCVCEFLVAILGVTIATSNVSGQRALIALVCIYVGTFASTWGPVAWVVTGEIFPLNVRAKGISLSAASNWLWNWALAFATPYLVNSGAGNAGLGVKVFFIWGSTCAGCIVFTYFCIPETKGLSLEQIDFLYQNSTPVTSPRYRRQLIAESDAADDVRGDMRVAEDEKGDASWQMREVTGNGV